MNFIKLTFKALGVVIAAIMERLIKYVLKLSVIAIVATVVAHIVGEDVLNLSPIWTGVSLLFSLAVSAKLLFKSM